jgi:serine/threonine protein kinase
MIHLHRENIIHRDLAARNILIDDNDAVRITDFGLARFVQQSVANTNSNIGAVAWMSPEAVTKRQYSQKSDVWSFGVTLWEMCTGELPFSGMEPIQVAVQIAKGATLTGGVPLHNR